MPWCAECDRFLSPPTVNPDGTCPTCGRPVEVHRPAVEGRPATAEAHPNGLPGAPEEGDLPPVPFHLKALGAATVVYLGYRMIQGISWIIHHV